MCSAIEINFSICPLLSPSVGSNVPVVVLLLLMMLAACSKRQLIGASLYPCFVKFVDIIHDTNNCFRKYTDYFVKNQRFHGKSRRKILFAMFLSKHFTIRYLRLYWRTIVKLR